MQTLQLVSLIRVILLSAGLFLATIRLSAQRDSAELRMTATELSKLKSQSGTQAPGSSNLSAVQVVVLFGDPAKPGLYTILLRVAPNTKIPAHLHPDDRVGNVVSGTWYFGYGDAFDEKKLKKLPPGSVYTEVGNQNHFAMTGKDVVLVALTGYGPSGVTYVNPADDPETAKKPE
ncbi:MAG: hypothetical protein EOO09_06760 [Chitinophagaceae bacterium]|nr:MAG: hypothetical protein EOO09_06760 [Chitinophagaceae bacterium]